MQDFLGGGATLKSWEYLVYLPRCCEPLLEGFGGMLPQEKNSAIFNHFHDKKFFQININKQDYYHCSIYNAAPPLIYLNINVMDTYSI